jgi:hypothetical protein
LNKGHLEKKTRGHTKISKIPTEIPTKITFERSKNFQYKLMKKKENIKMKLLSTHPSFFSQGRKSKKKCNLVFTPLLLNRDVGKKERSANPLDGL